MTLGLGRASVETIARSRGFALRGAAAAFLAFAAVIAGCVVIWAFDPAVYGFYPRCPLHIVTGLFCPGCGGTRAISRLLHGDIIAAFDYNALLTALAPLTAVWCFSSLISMARGRAVAEPNLNGFRGWALLSAFAVFWVVRNLPWWPFDYFAP